MSVALAVFLCVLWDLKNDLNFIELLKNNFPEFKEFFEVFEKDKNFESLSLRKYKESFTPLKKTDIAFTNKRENFE